jgi:hypothetical protein
MFDHIANLGPNQINLGMHIPREIYQDERVEDRLSAAFSNVLQKTICLAQGGASLLRASCSSRTNDYNANLLVFERNLKDEVDSVKILFGVLVTNVEELTNKYFIFNHP